MTRAPHTPPFTIAVDGAEKKPYRFKNLRTDAKLGSRPLAVPVEWRRLPTGDYSLVGFEKLVCVERKSKEDLFATLSHHRDRFEKEHERMAAMGAGSTCVIVEASWWEILTNPPERSRLNPKTIHRTAISWFQRYAVPWFTMDSRELAEVTTYRFLEKWYFEWQAAVSPAGENCRKCGRPLSDHKSRGQGMGPVCAARGDRLLALEHKRRGSQADGRPVDRLSIRADHQVARPGREESG